MDLFTEFFRRLSTELSPFWKWSIRHWPVVLDLSRRRLLASEILEQRQVVSTIHRTIRHDARLQSLIARSPFSILDPQHILG